MKATVLNFKGGKNSKVPNQVLIEIEGCNSKAVASKFIGKRVVWKSPANKEIFGKITQPHGTKGVLRVRFSKGLPGQALGSKIEVLEA